MGFAADGGAMDNDGTSTMVTVGSAMPTQHDAQPHIHTGGYPSGFPPGLSTDDGNGASATDTHEDEPFGQHGPKRRRTSENCSP